MLPLSTSAVLAAGGLWQGVVLVVAALILLATSWLDGRRPPAAVLRDR